MHRASFIYIQIYIPTEPTLEWLISARDRKPEVLSLPCGRRRLVHLCYLLFIRAKPEHQATRDRAVIVKNSLRRIIVVDGCAVRGFHECREFRSRYVSIYEVTHRPCCDLNQLASKAQNRVDLKNDLNSTSTWTSGLVLSRFKQ